MTAGHAFVSVKVRKRFHRWIKQEAARRGITMYALIEQYVRAQYLDGAPPWEARPTPCDCRTTIWVDDRCVRCGRSREVATC